MTDRPAVTTLPHRIGATGPVIDGLMQTAP